MNAIMNVQIDENKVKEEVMSKVANDIRRETKNLEKEAVETRREIKRNLMDELEKHIDHKIDLHMQSISENYIEDRINSVIENAIKKEVIEYVGGFYSFKDKLLDAVEMKKHLGFDEYLSRSDAFHTGVEFAYLFFNNVINPNDEESKSRTYDNVMIQVASIIADRIKLSKNTREKMAESIANALSQMQTE